MKDLSVLISTYNHGRFLRYQLKSLLAQTEAPKRILVLDDGSTDETVRLPEEFAAFPSVRMIRYDRNRGLHAALTELMGYVDTELFAFAAADDILARDWCSTLAALMEAHPQAKMAVANSFIYSAGNVEVTDFFRTAPNARGMYESREFLALLLRHGRFPPSNTIMYRSDIIEELIRPIFSRRELASLTDLLLMLAIAVKYPVVYSAKPLGVFIKSEASYGNSFFSREGPDKLLAIAWKFSMQEGYVPHPEVVEFLLDSVNYTWAATAIRSELSVLQGKKGGLRASWALLRCYFAWARAAYRHRQYRYVRAGSFPRDRQRAARQMNGVLDSSVLARFGNDVTASGGKT